VSRPKPEPGLVIRYSYLCRAKYLRGQEEGAKDRPCAILLAPERIEDGTLVVVLPVTQSPPDKSVVALEIPSAIKRLLASIPNGRGLCCPRATASAGVALI
jgi:mRNA-degrading endonuclease toxin of MazEF toxin-antitoxin module